MAALPRFVSLNSGFRMPVIGFGTYMMTGDVARQAVDHALCVGYRLLDTAHSYLNEREIGDVIRTRIRAGKLRRKDVFITTKLPSVYLAHRDVRPCVHESLEHLGIQSVDMLLIHNPWGNRNRGDGTLRPVDERGQRELEVIDFVDTWLAMESLVRDDLAKSIGVSNFTPSQIERIWAMARVKPSNLQSECHVYLQQRQLRAYCRSRGVVMTSYGTLGSPKRAGESVSGPLPMNDSVVGRIAESHGKTPAQILLRNLLQRNMVVIPKSATAGKIEENLNVFDFVLSEEEMEHISRLDRDLKYFRFEWAQKHPYYIKGEPF